MFNCSEKMVLSNFACNDSCAVRENMLEQEKSFYPQRSQFCRDRDRILYSKSFRRLAYKTQVYLTSESSKNHNDHIRTRLTHTLEVAQIAKTMARYLYLNEDLVEAMSFGHDIGHAPFGHAGEEQLNQLINGVVNLPTSYIVQHKIRIHSNRGEKLLDRISYGDFRHNYQSIRQLTLLEVYNTPDSGMNLTFQCLDGILRHTKLNSRADPSRNCKYPGTENDIIGKLISRKGFKFTVESRLVFLADEIAQVSHDINDAVGLGVISFDTLRNQLKDPIDAAKSSLSALGKDINFHISSNDHINNSTLCSLLIALFTIETAKNIGKVLLDNSNSNLDEIESLLQTVPSPNPLFEKFRIYKNDLVINNYNVNRMDNKGRYIIRQLFYAYLSDPRQMPDSYLRLYMKIKKQQITSELTMDQIWNWFDNCNGFMEEEARLSKNEFNEVLMTVCNDIDGTSFRKLDWQLLERLIPYLLQDGDYIRLIIDYIATMSDGFAEKEVAFLYGYRPA